MGLGVGGPKTWGGRWDGRQQLEGWRLSLYVFDGGASCDLDVDRMMGLAGPWVTEAIAGAGFPEALLLGIGAVKVGVKVRMGMRMKRVVGWESWEEHVQTRT